MEKEIYQDLRGQIPEIKEALLQGASYASEIGEKVIMYDLVIHVFYSSILSILLVIFIKNFTKWNKWILEKGDDYGIEPLPILYLWNGVFLFLFPGVVVVNLQIILKNIFTPELRIIEIVSNLIK